jgi:hypothetical protein
VYTMLVCSHVLLGIIGSVLTAPSTFSMSCASVVIPPARHFCQERGLRHSRAVMTEVQVFQRVQKLCLLRSAPYLR